MILLGLRNLAGYTTMAAATLLLLVASVFVPPQRILGTLKAMLRGGFRAFGWDVTVEDGSGVDLRRGVVLMPNHLTSFDHFLILAYLPGYMIGLEKIETLRIPLYGWAARRWGQVHVDRADHEAALASCRRLQDQLSAGRTVVIFPEGTRSPDGRLGPFKKGGFHIAVEVGGAVVPLAFLGLAPLFPKGRRLVKPGRVRIRLGAAIPAQGVDAEGLLVQVREAIEGLLAPPNPGSRP